MKKKWTESFEAYCNGTGQYVSLLRSTVKRQHSLVYNESDCDEGLVSFSEATRYTTSKRLEAEAWCRANNKTLPQHTLYPRTKGFVACVQMLRSAAHVKAVYDITVAYAKKNGRILQQPPTFPQSITYPSLDEKWRFFVHVERYAIEDLPKTNEEIAEWLEERWIEKGDHLEILEQKMQKGLPWEPF